jgi:hypothetical protein
MSAAAFRSKELALTEDKPIMFVRDEKEAVWKGDAKSGALATV